MEYTIELYVDACKNGVSKKQLKQEIVELYNILYSVANKNYHAQYCVGKPGHYTYRTTPPNGSPIKTPIIVSEKSKIASQHLDKLYELLQSKTELKEKNFSFKSFNITKKDLVNIATSYRDEINKVKSKQQEIIK